jgi:hypothetical protein
MQVGQAAMSGAEHRKNCLHLVNSVSTVGDNPSAAHIFILPTAPFASCHPRRFRIATSRADEDA